MDSGPPNSTLQVTIVQIGIQNHDFYTFFALFSYDLSLSAVSTLLLFPEIHYYITELMQFFRQKMSQVLRYGNFQSFFIHKTLLHQNESMLLPQSSAIFLALKKCM